MNSQLRSLLLLVVTSAVLSPLGPATPVAEAAVPLQMPLSGALRDNAGQPVGQGAFEVTFTLYADAEGTDALWSESWAPAPGGDCADTPEACLQVNGGVFRIMLGANNPLDLSLFAGSGGVWLGMQVETDPELPLRPLGSTAYSLHSGTSAGLSCSGCVSPEALSEDTLQTIRDEVVSTLGVVGAGAIPYDGAGSGVGAEDVQGAIDELKELLDNSPAGGGQVNEGAGQVIVYDQDRSVPAYGSTKQYVHMIQPSTPKVVAHVYGDQSANFGGSDNLVVAFDFAPNQYSAGATGTQGEFSVNVTNPSIFNTGAHVMLHQTVGGDGLAGGDWELNQVLAVNGTSLQLLKPLQHSYTSNGTVKAQVVLAASFGQLEVVSGGLVRAAEPLAADGSKGGIVYIRANKVTVKSGGRIDADGVGFSPGGFSNPGASACGVIGADGSTNPNCGGGGAATTYCGSAGGGGNMEAGEDGLTDPNCGNVGEGGEPQGSEQLDTLQFGGAGGSTQYRTGGKGGGIIVVGAQTFIVQEGAEVTAHGTDGVGGGSGGGAGGSVVVYTDQWQVTGDVSAAGGSGGVAGQFEYITPVRLDDVSFNTHSHGAGFSPSAQEFWYPEWSGSTVYRFDLNYNQIGTFNAGSSDMMGFWGDTQGRWYTANWGQDTIRGFNSNGGQIWSQSIGSTSGAVCSTDATVYGMRHSGDTVYMFNPDNGGSQGTFNYPSITGSVQGGLVCTPDRLYRVSDGGAARAIAFDDTSTVVESWSIGAGANNVTFDGSTIYTSPNSSNVRRWRIMEGNIYESKTDGGAGGAGWVVQETPVQGVVNESYPKGVELWVDGVDVTATVGDPNGLGEPAWDADTNTWGGSGLDAWHTGPLDLTNVANWTLGEHLIELRETGGAGGQLKSYLYVIYPFTESTAPPHDTCGSPVILDPAAAPVVTSGTTEDTMGKTLATDDYEQAGCGGFGGPDVVYRIDLPERSLLHGAIVAPFSTKMYLRAADCEGGELVLCADKEFTSAPIDAGTYFLIVDSDSPNAKGDFSLAVSTTPAPIPANDHCDGAVDLTFGAQGVATVSSSTLYAQDDYKGLCSAALSGGPDVLYTFTAGTGESLEVTLQSDFESVMYLMAQGCGDAGFPLACSSNGSLSVQGLSGGQYWLSVDGVQPLEWGNFDLTVTVN